MESKTQYIALNIYIYKDKLEKLKSNEIEIQKRRKPAAGETFYSIYHSRKQVINGIENAIYSPKYIYKDKLKKTKLN